MSKDKGIVNSSDVFKDNDFLDFKQEISEDKQEQVTNEKFQSTKIGEYDEKKLEELSAEESAIKDINLAEDELNEFEQWFLNFKEYSVGEMITGTVTNILNNTVYVDISYKAEGIIEPDELSFTPNIKAKDIMEIGDEVYVQILRLENREGNPVLSKKRADYVLAWEKLSEAADNKESIEAFILGRMNDGLLATFNGIRCYIPPTQLIPETQAALEKAKHTTMEVRVLKADRRRKRVILSEKAISGEQRKEAKEFVENINIGDTVKGTVSNIKSYGAFVNIGPTHGLIHISELSWSRVDSVEEKLAIGDEIEARVCGKDEEKVKISLTLKDPNNDPWEQIKGKYNLGDIAELLITRIAPFGAFAELIPGVEGLIHISEFSDQRVTKVTDVVNSGDKVKAMIIRLNHDTNKIAFSIKSAQQKDEELASPSEIKKETVNSNPEIISDTNQEEPVAVSEKSEIETESNTEDVKEPESVNNN